MKFSFAALAACAFGAAALSQNVMAFDLYASALVSPNVVTANACNSDYDSVIVCNVTATGMLNTGVPIFATATLMIPPGQCRNAYVYANFPFGFINGAANAECQFQ